MIWSEKRLREVSRNLSSKWSRNNLSRKGNSAQRDGSERDGVAILVAEEEAGDGEVTKDA